MKALLFGEIVWDVFGESREIGGAPLNVCGHLAKLRNEAYLFSALGRDALGAETRERLRALGIHTDYVSPASYPTGTCQVSKGEDGNPRYTLLSDTAYDHMPLTEGQLAAIRSQAFDVFYFGTVAQRSSDTVNVLETLLEECRFPVVYCDINIRPPFSTKEALLRCLRHSTILKVSREEQAVFRQFDLLPQGLPQHPAGPNDYLHWCRGLAEAYGIFLVLVTLDKEGAILYDRASDRLLTAPLPKNAVVSTVGAGDSFSAGFLHHYLSGKPLQTCMDKASLLSDYVVTQQGALPDYPSELLAQLL